MRASAGGYLWSETGKSIWRNKMSSFLSCATTALALFLLGVAVIISLNMDFMYNVLQNQMEIQAYLKPEVTSSEGRDVLAAIKEIPGVSDAVYISQEDALEELKAMFQENASVLDGLQENPLPASIRVKATQVTEIPTIVGEIRKRAEVDDVIYQEGTAESLASLGRASQYLSLVGMIVVGLVAIMVIGNSIRLTIDARRHEIGIMKLVGATDSFIIGPFLLEGIILGVLGGLLGEAMVVGLYDVILDAARSTVPFLPILSLTADTALDMLGIMLSTGVAVGALGSVIALRKHLRV